MGLVAVQAVSTALLQQSQAAAAPAVALRFLFWVSFAPSSPFDHAGVGGHRWWPLPLGSIGGQGKSMACSSLLVARRHLLLATKPN